MTIFIPPALLWAMAGLVALGLFLSVLAFIGAARINRGEDDNA